MGLSFFVGGEVLYALVRRQHNWYDVHRVCWAEIVFNLDDDLTKCLPNDHRFFLLKKICKGKLANKQAKKSQPPVAAGSLKRDNEGTVIQPPQPTFLQPQPQLQP
ncbi:hypothetical protein B5807_08829 [Epicoccum nigrum]|uniref:Uncharacterized protein n=1 Tax=Epicoccum nigrum TaxID=105696 RepID=A0A1Y2LUM4_EPING|nr:hypothetical protein B5807_08829 [Epicoccum nigrum]